MDKEEEKLYIEGKNCILIDEQTEALQRKTAIESLFMKVKLNHPTQQNQESEHQ